jgi:hypothetical protein
LIFILDPGVLWGRHPGAGNIAGGLTIRGAMALPHETRKLIFALKILYLKASLTKAKQWHCAKKDHAILAYNTLTF